MKNVQWTFRAAWAMLLSLSCANQGMPPGGPEDKTPPQIVRTQPEKNAINVPRNTGVEFEFSEKIDTRSASSGVFISPNPGRDVEIKASGSKLRVVFADSLRTKTTYTITIGTEIKDLRGNALAESFTLGFSTGDEIDTREISGRVFGNKANEITVWAYMIDDSDTLDPAKSGPTYLTQCNQKGEFRFTNLAERTYRLFAVRDLNRDQLYNKGAEQIGLTSSDVDLTGRNRSVSGRLFRMMSEDTSEVAILSLDQTDNRHIRIRFSKAISINSDISGSVNLHGIENNDPVPVHDIINIPDNPEVWTITTAPRDSAEYLLHIFNIQDKNHRSLGDSIQYEFTSISSPDTTEPRLGSLTPPDSSVTLGLRQFVEFLFSEGMDTTHRSPIEALLEDSTQSASFSGKWLSPHKYRVLPVSRWKGRAWLQSRLDPDQCMDMAGNQLDADKLSFAWRTLNPDTLSSVSGLVTDQDSLASGDFFLHLRQTPGERVYDTVQMSGSQGYAFEGILPGKYMLGGFRDEDGNGVYTFGSSYPYEPSERFFFSQDTILVRAKWPNEGNNYEIRR